MRKAAVSHMPEAPSDARDGWAAITPSQKTRKAYLLRRTRHLLLVEQAVIVGDSLSSLFQRNDAR
jgi:hypothetical protein